jgi:hypothetical protein
LKAQIATLIRKRKCEYRTPIEVIQQLLYQEYNVESTQEEIEDELLDMWYEEEYSYRIREVEEDFFNGY